MNSFVGDTPAAGHLRIVTMPPPVHMRAPVSTGRRVRPRGHAAAAAVMILGFAWPADVALAPAAPGVLAERSDLFDWGLLETVEPCREKDPCEGSVVCAADLWEEVPEDLLSDEAPDRGHQLLAPPESATARLEFSRLAGGVSGNITVGAVADGTSAAALIYMQKALSERLAQLEGVSNAAAITSVSNSTALAGPSTKQTWISRYSFCRWGHRKAELYDGFPKALSAEFSRERGSYPNPSHADETCFAGKRSDQKRRIACRCMAKNEVRDGYFRHNSMPWVMGAILAPLTLWLVMCICALRHFRDSWRLGDYHSIMREVRDEDKWHLELAKREREKQQTRWRAEGNQRQLMFTRLTAELEAAYDLRDRMHGKHGIVAQWKKDEREMSGRGSRAVVEDMKRKSQLAVCAAQIDVGDAENPETPAESGTKKDVSAGANASDARDADQQSKGSRDTEQLQSTGSRDSELGAEAVCNDSSEEKASHQAAEMDRAARTSTAEVSAAAAEPNTQSKLQETRTAKKRESVVADVGKQLHSARRSTSVSPDHHHICVSGAQRRASIRRAEIRRRSVALYTPRPRGRNSVVESSSPDAGHFASEDRSMMGRAAALLGGDHGPSIAPKQLLRRAKSFGLHRSATQENLTQDALEQKKGGAQLMELPVFLQPRATQEEPDALQAGGSENQNEHAADDAAPHTGNTSEKDDAHEEDGDVQQSSTPQAAAAEKAAPSAEDQQCERKFGEQTSKRGDAETSQRGRRSWAKVRAAVQSRRFSKSGTQDVAGQHEETERPQPAPPAQTALSASSDDQQGERKHDDEQAKHDDQGDHDKKGQPSRRSWAEVNAAVHSRKWDETERLMAILNPAAGKRIQELRDFLTPRTPAEPVLAVALEEFSFVEAANEAPHAAEVDLEEANEAPIVAEVGAKSVDEAENEALSRPDAGQQRSATPAMCLVQDVDVHTNSDVQSDHVHEDLAQDFDDLVPPVDIEHPDADETDASELDMHSSSESEAEPGMHSKQRHEVSATATGSDHGDGSDAVEHPAEHWVEMKHRGTTSKHHLRVLGPSETHGSNADLETHSGLDLNSSLSSPRERSSRSSSQDTMRLAEPEDAMEDADASAHSASQAHHVLHLQAKEGAHRAMHSEGDSTSEDEVRSSTSSDGNVDFFESRLHVEEDASEDDNVSVKEKEDHGGIRSSIRNLSHSLHLPGSLHAGGGPTPDRRGEAEERDLESQKQAKKAASLRRSSTFDMSATESSDSNDHNDPRETAVATKTQTLRRSRSLFLTRAASSPDVSLCGGLFSGRPSSAGADRGHNSALRKTIQIGEDLTRKILMPATKTLQDEKQRIESEKFAKAGEFAKGATRFSSVFPDIQRYIPELERQLHEIQIDAVTDKKPPTPVHGAKRNSLAAMGKEVKKITATGTNEAAALWAQLSKKAKGRMSHLSHTQDVEIGPEHDPRFHVQKKTFFMAFMEHSRDWIYSFIFLTVLCWGCIAGGSYMAYVHLVSDENVGKYYNGCPSWWIDYGGKMGSVGDRFTLSSSRAGDQ